ncbi:helix-turn-helix domain-containing protein [Burkholderia gladioli]|uniref:helix-turn-helix domain-containing protein n=1 Tax=Burkholderia gladioli TaxID=28095 RepID=UPI00163EB3EE|nr:helix-turn-helix transcriptional regulator [Burkholderia gladioli]
MSTLTEFGKEVRKLRIEHGETMLDMSKRVNKSPSFLSAVETGRKPVPTGLAEDIAQAYELTGGAAARLRELAELSVNTYRIAPKNEEEQTLVAAFARKLDSLDDSQRRSLLRILMKE